MCQVLVYQSEMEQRIKDLETQIKPLDELEKDAIAEEAKKKEKMCQIEEDKLPECQEELSKKRSRNTAP